MTTIMEATEGGVQPTMAITIGEPQGGERLRCPGLWKATWMLTARVDAPWVALAVYRLGLGHVSS